MLQLTFVIELELCQHLTDFVHNPQTQQQHGRIKSWFKYVLVNLWSYLLGVTCSKTFVRASHHYECAKGNRKARASHG